MLSNQLCQCGCGRYVPIATRTDSRRNQKKGEPMKYLAGHNQGTGGAALGPILDSTVVELDESRIRELRSMPDSQAARILDDRMRALETSYKRTFVERGFIALEVEERQLWRHLCDQETGDIHTSFERWVVTAATHSRSDVFASLRAVKELRDIPRAQLLNLPRKSIEVLRQLSPKVRRDAEVLEQARTASKSDFIGHIQKHHPDQHVEHELKQVTHPTASQREVCDLAREVACWLNETKSREQADEAIAAFYLQADCEREGFTLLSNRRAYETAKARGQA